MHFSLTIDPLNALFFDYKMHPDIHTLRRVDTDNQIIEIIPKIF